jgi:hypothetical protein
VLPGVETLRVDLGPKTPEDESTAVETGAPTALRSEKTEKALMGLVDPEVTHLADHELISLHHDTVRGW